MKARVSPAEFVDNPRWAEVVPEDDTAVVQRHLPAHEDCQALDVEAVQRHLRKGGTLGAMGGYEERPGQIDMCGSIVHAFNTRSHLMVEAGTGVGKSLAYLLPSVHWAWANDTPVIVSTATRNLQSQLLGADIPRALKTLPGEGREKFRVALLKGRTNYLCLKAVDEFFASGYWTMSKEDQAAMPEFVEWLSQTPDGDLDTFDAISHSLLSRPGDECAGRKCPFRTRCFVYKARRRAAAAHLIVVNHALVMAEAGSSGGILPAYSRLVMDEAHNLESIATEYLSTEFSIVEANRVARRILRHHREASARVAAMLSGAEELLAFLGRLLPPKTDLRRYSRGTCYWQDLARLAELRTRFERPLVELVNYLHDYCEALEDDDLQLKLQTDASELVALANAAAFVIDGDRAEYAYWVERVRVERRRAHVRLVAAPLSVAEQLHAMFFELKDSVVLCSATLRVGNDFRYMSRRLGFRPPPTAGADAAERFRTVTAESPFDYFRQASVLAVDSLPDPSADPPGYALALAAIMRDLFETTAGRALVLFTSYEMMNAVAAAARDPLAAAGIELFVQGEGVSREAMTDLLRNIGRTVLFGAQSFWEGVDVAGAALSCVVISRLPFAQVKHPIVEARSEAVERAGGSAFRDYALPEAVIKFRQGFGRLIRTKSDRGVVVVTDPRLVTKNYGAVFRRSIPATVHTVTGLDELCSRVSEFLG